jgi:hypothetical protein
MGSEFENVGKEFAILLAHLDGLEAQAGAGGQEMEAAAKSAIEIYRAASGMRKQLDDVIGVAQGRAKQVLTAVIAATGRTNWKSQFGSAYIPAPSVSVRYDAEALDALCAADPELAAKLRPFRSEQHRAGSLTIR